MLFSLFSKELVTVVTDSAFHSSSKVMPILFYVAFFSGIAMFTMGLNIKKKTLIVAILVIVFALVNIGLNQLLIPQYKLYGAAVATLISTSAYYITSFFVSQRHYQFEFPLFKVLLCLLVNSAMILVLVKFDPEISLNIVLLKIGIILAYMFLLQILNILNYKQIYNYFKLKLLKKK